MRALLPLWTLAPVAIQLKNTQLDLANAAELYASLANEPGTATLPTTVFLADAWAIGLALPALLVLGLWRVRPARRPGIVAGVASALVVFLFVELKVLWEVGTFLPLGFLLRGAVQADGMQFAADYIALPSVAKLLVAVACTWGTAVLVTRLHAGRMGRLVDVGALAVAVLFLGAGSFSLLSHPTGVGPIDRGVMEPALRAFVGLERSGPPPEPGVSTASLEAVLAAYRASTGAPVPNPPSARFGRASGYNVVLVVFETAPEDCVGVLAGDRTFPAIEAATARAIVARRHYATYPWTLRALYSVYTGWYPSSSPTEMIPRALTGPDGRLTPLPGLVRSLRHAGYFTKVYMPKGADDWDGQYAAAAAAGFEAHVDQPEVEVDGANLPDRMEWRREADRELLATLQADLQAHARSARPFFFAYQPQYTHAPWQGIEATRSREDACRLARGVFKEMDFQVGEITRTLVRAGLADRTMLVMVGDHGFRTRREFPWLSAGVIEELNFRVPLAMSVPGLLAAREEITWPTSHIDIAPSVLDLLGIRDGRAAEMGSPVWADGLQRRRVFVWGEGFVGANGYIDSTGAYMVKYQFDGAGAHRDPGTLDFDVHQVVNASPLRRSVDAEIHRMAAWRDRVAALASRGLVEEPPKAISRR